MGRKMMGYFQRHGPLGHQQEKKDLHRVARTSFWKILLLLNNQDRNTVENGEPFFPKMNENISGCKMIETEKLGKNLDNFTNYYKFRVIEWSIRLHKNKKEMMYHSQ